MILGADHADRLLAQHLAEAVQVFGAAALDVVDLPPLSGGTIEPAQLRAAAVLVWARELTLLLPITSSADSLMRYWRHKKERLSADERRELFERVLGAPGEADAPMASFEHFVDALIALGRAPVQERTLHLQTAIAVSARDAAAALSARAAGMAAWAARDITAHVREALALLDERDLAFALGGGSLWTRITLHAPDVLRQRVDPGTHVARAVAGLHLVEWLADQARALDAMRVQVRPTDDVVRAAETWRANATAVN